MKRTDWNAENVGLELDQSGSIVDYSTIDTKRRHMSTNVASHYFNNVSCLIARRF
jgi:hypothetical protein